MDVVVQKYGGSSLHGENRLRNVARRVALAHFRGERIVVVVSARGDTTDRLLDLAGHVGGPECHIKAGRETDQLLATGECVSAALLALALERMRVPATSLTGPQAGIRVTGRHRAGVIDQVETRRITGLLDEGRVVVVGGFQGVNDAGDVVTLGRGGSDTTAVALAAALEADRCEIFTDVDGVYSADPRIVASARRLSRVNVGVMAEMAFAGATVLHPRSVELAAFKGVELHVRSSLRQSEGTVVAGGVDMRLLETDSAVSAITCDLDVARVLVRSTTGGDLAAEVLGILARHAVPVDLVARSGPHEEEFRMGFTIRHSDVEEIRPALEAAAARSGGEARMDTDVAKVSVIGMGLLNRPEYVARMTTALAVASIPTSWVSCTQLRASATVPRSDHEEALRALHKEFESEISSDDDLSTDENTGEQG
ncbi:aspartate kinase [Streptomyces sp. NPDC047022]|uniref:aspartate kinase n=1 Tax=Streptomyces sp. NPDC047022 TaxID=3155737 RepID=UPI0033D28457